MTSGSGKPRLWSRMSGSEVALCTATGTPSTVTGASPGEIATQGTWVLRADIVITPREAFPRYQSFRNTFLLSDRLLCAIDADNEAVGQTLSLEPFSSLPYLATTRERKPSAGQPTGSGVEVAASTQSDKKPSAARRGSSSFAS